MFSDATLSDINVVLCYILSQYQVQGADDILGQFLDQDFEASANHRNILRHSLESCPSLVSPNVKNHQYLQKYVGRIQNLYNSPKSFAHRKKLTGDCKVSKSAHVPGVYLLKKVLNQNQDAG